MNSKIKELITIFLIQLVVTLPLYTVDVFALTISNVKVTKVTANSATIEWGTSNVSNGKVKYGKTIALGFAQTHANFVENHTLTLSNSIDADTTYFFSVESTDKSGNTAIDNNSDSLYTFKTLEKTSSANKSSIETGPPPINVTIPRYWNRRTVDITGTTRPFSSVTLFVNDFNLPKKSLSSNEVASGKFTFSQVQLGQENVIKIVIVDKSGNKNEKTFEVSVDTEEPVVKLSNITSLTSKPNLTISGIVNEPVIIKIFVDTNINESSTPSKIKGLNATKIGQNSVELKWDESKDKDFSHYVVYRTDAGAIALTKPANYNFFIDPLVDSGKEYKYEVSAVNIFGNEGPKSGTITVKTLEGGAILNLQHAPVDIFEDFRKPLLIINASDKFDFGLRLNKGDGIYTIKLVFEDNANNKVTIEKSITLDTKKPTVKIINPPSGTLIFENIANEIDIIGKTKPNARVHLFVDRLPFSIYEQTIEITGLPSEAQGTSQTIAEKRLDIDVKVLEDRIQNLSEAELESKCPLKTTSCKGADKSVTADKEGNFVFEKVDLTASGLAARLREVPVTEFRDVQLNQEARESRKTTIIVIATDKIGQRGAAKQTINIGTCWSGNQSWDIIPLAQYQSPSLLSTERMAEGTETIYFYFNYSYIGRGVNAKITDVSLSKACGTREIADPRFNISCQTLPSGGNVVKLNKPDNTMSYSAILLNRLPNMDRFLEADWKSLLNALGFNKELTFPFKVRITYKHNIIDDEGVEREVTETQTTCQEVSYVVDSTLIDPRKVMPDFLLYDFVDFLQNSIKALTKVQEQIDKVLDYVAIGCLYSFFAHLIFKIYRNWIDLSSEKIFILQNFLFNTGNAQDDQDCKILADAIVKGYGLGSIKDLKLKYFSDPNLKRCFPASYNAWQRETNLYQWQRWSCDRVFGHASPSKWTEKESDTELLRKIESQESCAVDESVRGEALRAVKCRDIDLSEYGRKKEDFELDKKCFETKIDNEKVLLTLAQPVKDNIYQVTELKNPSRVKISYAIKRNENYFLTASPKSCEELCGIKTKSGKKELVLGDKKIILSKDPKDKSGNEKAAYCTIVDTCRTWNANKAIFDAEGTSHKIQSTFRMGYASKVSDTDLTPCFYDDGKSTNVVSDSPAQREECCCINAKEGELPLQYYQPDDVDIATGKSVHESKTADSSALSVSPTKFEDMKWSYRYSRIKFEAKGTKDGAIHSNYNPNRYTERRDLPACFGQDNLFYKIFGKEKEVLTVNPFKQDTAVVQCAYLTGINQRLQLYKNIMTAMSNCLIEIRTSGRADAGVCKELFTQHVCGLIWQAVRFFIDGCTPDDLALDAGDKENSVADKIRLGFRGIAQGISEAQQEITEEYGNAKLDNLLGVGEGGVARKVCLAAFGYDWEFNARNLIDAAYTTPFATLVQAVTRSREFLTVDPVTLRPKYEYRASWIVNPGCDLENYRVELACVSRKELDEYPNSINCGAVGAPSIAYTGALGTSTAYTQCDCLELPKEQTRSFTFETRLKQNQLVEKDRHEVVEDNYRYDHLKFTLRTDRRILPNIQQNCFPTGYEKGVFYFPIIDKTAMDIADCTVQPLTGVFSCGSGTPFFSRKGTAQLIEVTINGEKAENVKELSIGDSLRVGARVTKTGTDKCFRVSISPDIINPAYEGIILNGTNDVPELLITDSLRVAGRTGNVVAPGISYKLISQNNQEPVAISVIFIDNADKNKAGYKADNEKVYSIDDKVVIDGWEVDLAEGKIKDTPKGRPETTIKVSGASITIEKENAAIEITGIAYTQTQAGSYQLQQVITINPPQQSTQAQQQPKIILVEIFNLKEDRDSYNGPDDCNLNDKAIEPRPYKFTVSEKGVDASKLGPVIQTPKINPSRQLIGKTVEISAKVTHKSGIEGVKITIDAPDGNNVVEGDAMTKIDDVTGYTYTFDTADKKPGKYSGNIKATSATKTESNLKFGFELIEQQQK